MSTPAAQALSGTAAPASAPPPAAAPPVAPGAAPAPAANDGFWKDWTAPEQKDVREWIANKNFADPFTLAKSARELETRTATLQAAANLKGYPTEAKNADGTVKPVDAQARAAWNATMGVPETADKYEIPVPANNPYPQFKTYMAEALHKAGVPAAMAPVLAKGYEEAIQRMETDIRAKEDVDSKAGLLELQRDWGTKYQENMALANRGRAFLTQHVTGMTEDKERSLEALLGTPTWLNLLQTFGAGNKEPGFAGGDGKPGFENSVTAAQSELDQLTADRAAGKITTERFRNRSAELADVIARGMAPAQ